MTHAPPDTPTGRYPAAILRADYLRSAAGLGLTVAPFLVTTPHPVVAVPCLLAAGVFGLFGLRTGLRQATRIRMDATGVIAEGPLPRAIRWDDLRDVRLTYFATRRDRQQGWMELTVKGGGRRLSVESTLDGFDALAARVAQAARDNRLALSDTTLSNFVALGHVIQDPRDNAPPSP